MDDNKTIMDNSNETVYEPPTAFDDGFEKIMEDRASADFNISDERLIEMSKKLPDWSLEPPYVFLKK